MEIIKTMKLPMQYRMLEIDRSAVDMEKRTVKMSFSSEEPIERWWGIEILDHSKGSMKMDRLKTGAPLLMDHNPSDQIGVIEKAWIEDDRGYAIARIGKSKRASEVFDDIVDGIRRNVSVGYIIDETILEKEEKGVSTYRVKSWTPLEISSVSIPADITVGVEREQIKQQYEVRVFRTSKPADNATNQEGRMEAQKETPAGAAAVKVTPNSEPNGEQMEASRINGIKNICKANNLGEKIQDFWIRSGMSFEDCSNELVKILKQRSDSNPEPITKLGLGPKEIKQYNLLRAIKAAADNEWDKAPYELEISRATADKSGKVLEGKRFLIPFEVLQRPIDTDATMRTAMAMGRRDLTVGTAGAGGYLVATDNVGFIEMLRNRSVAFRMGTTRLSGLRDNVTIPRQSASATAYWLSTEATAITESQQTFVQVALTPKTVGAYTEISRLLLLQSSPGAEGIVTNDLAQVVAVAADLVVLNGSGASGQPLGIIGTSGIGGVTGTSLAYAGLLEFQTDVAGSNVVPARGGYVTTPAVAALMMQRVKFASTASPDWEGNVWDGTMVGFPAMSSNQMPSANMLFGDWAEIVVGEWGVLELDVNPAANFPAGIIGVRALYSMDVGVRRPFAFSLATSIT